ncbi:MAG: hypothetical protein ACTHMC_16955 [Pseudobacter sp.]|uniref:hypothetical protein n=1 Tax=Pseudobacter sp. TaxID=2045420 RepID=UPI003F7D2159
MKSLFILLLLPFAAFSQQVENFGKFKSAEGVQISGTSLAKGYEKQLEVNNLKGTPAGNNTTLRFEIPTSPATAQFRNALNSGKKLPTGEIIVTVPGERRTLDHRIIMQDIEVVQCSDGNGNTQLELKAGRIGWVYYTTDKRGKSKVSSKAGWDLAANDTWTDF